MRKITEEQMQAIRNGDRRALSRKLTDKQVVAIRQNYGRTGWETYREIGARFGVSRQCVCDIVLGYKRQGAGHGA